MLATVTGARKGVIFDASLDDRFATTLLECLGTQEHAKTRRAAVRAIQTAAFAQLRGPDDGLRIRRPEGEQSNTSIIYGDRLIMKLFRRIEPGINPDFEIGRQLTERVRFSRVPGGRRGDRIRARLGRPRRSRWSSSWWRARGTAGRTRPTN